MLPKSTICFNSCLIYYQAVAFNTYAVTLLRSIFLARGRRNAFNEICSTTHCFGCMEIWGILGTTLPSQLGELLHGHYQTTEANSISNKFNHLYALGLLITRIFYFFLTSLKAIVPLVSCFIVT